MKSITLLVSALLLTLALARLPSAKLSYDPSEQIPEFLMNLYDGIKRQYLIMDKYKIWVYTTTQKAEDMTVSVNSTNHTVSMN